jgi:tetratricopeptide (TPR) repeat protein
MARKYIRRHRIGVVAAGSLVLLLAAFSAAQALELRRTIRERDRANRVTDFMTTMFKVSDPSEARGNAVTAREILDKASKEINTGLAQDPELQAQMMYIMGSVYNGLGLYPKSESLLSGAVNIRRRHLGPKNRDTLLSMYWLAQVLTDEGRFAEAEKLCRETLDILRAVNLVLRIGIRFVRFLCWVGP